jgi:hypothetical protein
MNEPSIKWSVETRKYPKGTVLFGINFNTNNEYCEKRESYVCLYLFKWIITVGRFYIYK